MRQYISILPQFTSLLILASALLLTACENEAQPSYTEAEKDAAMREYTSCLKDAADRLDDGISDPLNVAVAVASMCKSEFTRSSQMATELNPRAFQIFLTRYGQQSQIESASTIVLLRRKNLR